MNETDDAAVIDHVIGILRSGRQAFLSLGEGEPAVKSMIETIDFILDKPSDRFASTLNLICLLAAKRPEISEKMAEIILIQKLIEGRIDILRNIKR